MTNGIPCSVDGCDRRAQARGWCRMHWQRVARDGTPGSAEPRRRRPGSPVPPCKHEGCDLRSRVKGWCAAHYNRQRDGKPMDAPIVSYTKKSPPPCLVDGCDDPASARGWCKSHYHRWWRDGDPGPAVARRYGVIAVCTAEGCAEPHRARGYCELHYRRLMDGVSPTSRTFLAPPKRRVKDSYAAVHMRIASVWGSASQFACIECEADAEHWAYQHNDPNPRRSPEGMPYSTDIFGCYEPMCRHCHRRLDADFDRREALLA